MSTQALLHMPSRNQLIKACKGTGWFPRWAPDSHGFTHTVALRHLLPTLGDRAYQEQTFAPKRHDVTEAPANKRARIWLRRLRRGGSV